MLMVSMSDLIWTQNGKICRLKTTLVWVQSAKKKRKTPLFIPQLK